MTTAMSAQRAEARRTAMKEEITLILRGGGMAGGDAGESADVVRTVQRFRMEIDRVNKIFGIDVAYVEDETGGMVMPADIMWHCMPPPFKYFVIERVVPELPEDVQRDPWFYGQTQMVASDVPVAVGAADLVAWLQKGVEKSDARLQVVLEERQVIHKKLVRNRERSAGIPFVTCKAITDHGKAEERLLLTKTIQRESEQLQRELAELEPRLNREVKRRNVQQVKVQKTATQELEKTSTWYVAFSNPREAEAAMELDSWNRFKLFVGTDVDPPLAFFDDGTNDGGGVLGEEGKPEKANNEAGRGVGDETPPVHRFDDEVVMRGVQLRRLAHGKGAYTDWVWGDSYRGDFREGLRHGHGEHHERQGAYWGAFEHGQRFGQGRQVLASGDEYTGEFGHTLHHRTRPLLGGYDFALGRPHGNGGEIVFADGCTYSGELTDGVVTGQGEYRDPATGEMMAGSFLDGVLHGVGIHVKPNGEKFEGWFRHGQLHGKGSWASRRNAKKAHTCSGKFEHGEPHGFCRHIHRKGPRFSGFYRDGVRDGPGDIIYGNVAEYFHRPTGQLRRRHDSKYEGTWVAGTIQGRNCHVETSGDDFEQYEPLEQLYFTSKHMWARYPFLQQLIYKEERERSKRCRELRRVDQEGRKRLCKVTKEGKAEFGTSRRFAIRLYKAVYRRLNVPPKEEGDGAEGGGSLEEEDFEDVEDGESIYEEAEGEMDEDGKEDDKEEFDKDALEYCDPDWFSTGSFRPGVGHLKQDLSAINLSLSDVLEHPFTLQQQRKDPHVTTKLVDAFISELLREALPSY